MTTSYKYQHIIITSVYCPLRHLRTSRACPSHAGPCPHNNHRQTLRTEDCSKSPGIKIRRHTSSRQHIYNYYNGSVYRLYSPHVRLEKIRLPTGRGRKTWRASGTLGALAKVFQSWTTRAIRWAPYTHSCHVWRGTENAGHWRGIIDSSGRKVVPAENRLQNIRRRMV